jgi:L-ribulokinase
MCLGLDFGTDSVRAMLMDTAGKELGVAVSAYEHGQITQFLPAVRGADPVALAEKHVSQHAGDWRRSARQAVLWARKDAEKRATRESEEAKGLAPSGITVHSSGGSTCRRVPQGGHGIVGIGVAFTSCTMLPCMGDGTPLHLLPDDDACPPPPGPAGAGARWVDRPHAWPKLWKHHGAEAQAKDLTDAARAQGCEWLQRYSGAVGAEWLLPKVAKGGGVGRGWGGRG